MPVPENAIHYLEIVTTDVDALCNQYAQSHGWSFQAPAAELGNARVAELANGTLCGIRAPMSAEEKPVVRSYIRVSDLAAGVQQAKASGASILLDRMEIPGRGLIAIFELGGIQHGLWQLP